MDTPQAASFISRLNMSELAPSVTWYPAFLGGSLLKQVSINYFSDAKVSKCTCIISIANSAPFHQLFWHVLDIKLKDSL